MCGKQEGDISVLGTDHFKANLPLVEGNNIKQMTWMLPRGYSDMPLSIENLLTTGNLSQRDR